MLQGILFLMIFLLDSSLAQQENEHMVLPSISSENGVLHTSLELKVGLIKIPNTGIVVKSRLFNGTFPGPVFRLKPGDNFRIDYTNNLVDQGIPLVNNRISAPDDTNLHFHGLHVSGELPSDDTTHRIFPDGDFFHYNTTLPDYHMPGTHWIHPHAHGSTLLQVAGGAAGAIIVEDPPEYPLPEQVRNAREVLFLANQFDLDRLVKEAGKIGDNVTETVGGNLPGNSNKFVTVNGQLNPVIGIRPGEWIRLRVIWAAWVWDHLKGFLDLAIPGCEMQLLAKDGVYIRDFPRRIELAPVVIAGRADIMVRCMNPSSTYRIARGVDTIAQFQTSADLVDSTDLEKWTPPYPEYLSDLRDTPASDGCSCVTVFTANTANGRKFTYERIMHESYVGAVVDRKITAKKHPYHQHVHSYQLISDEFDSGDGYYALGDWHDTLQGIGTIRYQPTIVGKLMVHCHRLVHEDKGMMAIEMVNNATNAKCVCGKNHWPTWLLPTIISASLLFVLVLAGVIVICVKKRKNKT